MPDDPTTDDPDTTDLDAQAARNQDELINYLAGTGQLGRLVEPKSTVEDFVARRVERRGGAR